MQHLNEAWSYTLIIHLQLLIPLAPILWNQAHLVYSSFYMFTCSCTFQCLKGGKASYLTNFYLGFLAACFCEFLWSTTYVLWLQSHIHILLIQKPKATCILTGAIANWSMQHGNRCAKHSTPSADRSRHGFLHVSFGVSSVGQSPFSLAQFFKCSKDI